MKVDNSVLEKALVHWKWRVTMESEYLMLRMELETSQHAITSLFVCINLKQPHMPSTQL